MNWFKLAQDHRGMLERYQPEEETVYIYMYDDELPLEDAEPDIISI